MPAEKGIIQTVLGNGSEGWEGDGGPATAAACQTPYACEFDPQGNMVVCMGRHHRIRRVDATTGTVALICGTGEPGYAGDGGPAVDAVINQPYGLAIDANGDIYFAQRFDPAVRRIDGRTGMVSTVAGTGEFGYSGDGGPGNEAMLREPNDLCLDRRGGLLIADVQDQRIRRVDLATGIISTFAGTGEKSRAGEGRAATGASLMGPRAVCADSQGNVYVCEREGNGVRRISPDGVLTTIAGAEGVYGYAGDGGPALAAVWGSPKAMRCDLNDNIIVLDSDNSAVRRIDAVTGLVATIAGGREGGGGDGGPAVEAGLFHPHGCGINAEGNLFIADTHNHRVRVVGL
ncbi:MAG: hypothetical protein OXF79_01660 [Chloroflexi bacterium]|nr:hypothetical protein [Chloroflexota bacterium]